MSDTLVNRWCPQCVRFLSPESFGKDKNRPDGVACWCFRCRRIDMKARRADGVVVDDNAARYRRNPAIHKAKFAVRCALKAGVLIKPDTCPTCRIAGRRVEAHHHLGYGREHWLHVEWHCRSCHKLAHTRAAFGVKQGQAA